MRKSRSTSLSTATMIGGSTSYFSTPPVVDAGGIALVQSASGTTADGSAGLTVPFGAAIVTGIGAGTYTWDGEEVSEGRLVFRKVGDTNAFISYGSQAVAVWTIHNNLGISINDSTADANAILPWQASWTGSTVACSSPVTAGNTVLAFISFNDSTEDGMGGAACVGGGAESLGDVFGPTGPLATKPVGLSVHNVAGGETGVAFATTIAVRANNIIAEYSGLADAPAESTASSTATSTTLAIGTITPTSANNLLTAIFAFNADVTVVTPPAGWTLVDARQGGASVWQYVYQKIQTSADASNPTIVLSGSADIAGAAAAFGGV